MVHLELCIFPHTPKKLEAFLQGYKVPREESQIGTEVCLATCDTYILPIALDQDFSKGPWAPKTFTHCVTQVPGDRHPNPLSFFHCTCQTA